MYEISNKSQHQPIIFNKQDCYFASSFFFLVLFQANSSLWEVLIWIPYFFFLKRGLCAIQLQWNSPAG